MQLRTPPHNSPYIYSQQPTFPPIHDPRYLQVGGFAGTPPTYPIALHPQHSWRLPSDLASTMHPRTPTDYPAMFREDGAPAENYKEDRFGFTILPNSRGAFINPIPAYSTLEQVCENIRGGALERVDFHDYQGRTCVGFFFISAEEAMRYIKFCNQQGGVYWAGTGLVSKVEAIPTGKGGHEPIKANVSKGIREGATRCLKICHLPNNIDVELLKAQIKNQSRNVVAEIETIHMVPENPGSHPTFTGFIRMATIGTALGARLRLANLAYYKNCTFEFLPDPCAGTLEELTHKWNTEKYWDGCIARSKQLDTPSVPAPMEMQTMQGGLHPPSFLDLQRGVRTPPF